MKAVVYEQYGSPDVLSLREVDKPTVKADGVLIRVRAASVNRSDWETLTGSPAYVRFSGRFSKPKRPILGSDIAGIVEAVGPEVIEFQPGDEVFGDVMWHGAAGFAEYVSVPERAPIVRKPAGITFEEASALPQGAVIAVQGLRERGGVQPGQHVMINGAGGGAGSFAVQIAKSLGAEVTGIDNGEKLEMMRSIGGDHVIDYTTEDFAKSGRRYDRILDLAMHRSIFAYRSVLKDDGVYLVVGGSVPRLLQALVVGGLISKMGSTEMGLLVAKPNKEDLSYLAGLVEEGKLTPAIDKTYPLSEAPEALGWLGDGHAKGKVVITT